jgi:hypothetical protein
MRDRRYLKLLGGNFLGLPEPDRSQFIRRLRRDAAAVSDHKISVLLSGEWRGRLTASWLIAASRRTQFTDRLGDLLVASQLVYAGQGFCVALAGDGGETAAARLTEYLDVWLPRTSCRYDQAWAMAALACLDARAGTSHSARFLVPGGAWERWTADRRLFDEQVRLTEDLLRAIGV